MDAEWLGAVLQGILRTPISATSRCTARKHLSSGDAKWLALRLALLLGQPGPVGRSPSAELCKSVGISRRKEFRAFRDLELCGWIRDGRFDPDVTLSPIRVPNIGAIRHTLTYNDRFAMVLVAFAGQVLKPNNALLLGILLCLAGADGRVSAVSDRMLSRLTGFNPKHQLKTQMQRLQELGFVGLVVPGVTGRSVFRTTKSCVYLNLLHPCWQGLYPSWSGVTITRADWKRVTGESEAVGRRWLCHTVIGEITSRQEIRAFCDNFFLLVISEMMSMPSAIPVESPRLRAQVISALAPSGISDENLTWFLRELLRIASNILDELFKGRTPAYVEEGGWLFCLRPAHLTESSSSEARDSENYAVLTTNAMHINSRYPSLIHHPLTSKLWIVTGYLANPLRAWPKFRSGLHSASKASK